MSYINHKYVLLSRYFIHVRKAAFSFILFTISFFDIVIIILQYQDSVGISPSLLCHFPYNSP